MLEPEEPLRGATGVLRLHGGAPRRAAGARSAGAADNLRLAGCHSCRWRPDRRRAAGLAADAVEAEPPEWLVFGATIRIGVHGRQARPACARWRRRSTRKASTTLAPAGWSKALRATSWSPWMPGGPMSSSAVTRTYLEHLTLEKGAMACARRQWRSAGAVARPEGARPARARGRARQRRRGSILRREGRGVKLLRTIRLDPSDTFVFERAAEPGEWAVPGAFAFAHRMCAALEGKARAPFGRAFSASTRSAGRRWFRSSKPARPTARPRSTCLAQASGRALRCTRSCHRPAGGRGGDRVRSLAHATIPRACWLAVSRKYEDGAIREVFRTLTPGVGPKPIRAYAFLEVVGEDEPPTERRRLARPSAKESGRE